MHISILQPAFKNSFSEKFRTKINSTNLDNKSILYTIILSIFQFVLMINAIHKSVPKEKSKLMAFQ